jgi:hypothetical protein
MSELVRGIVNGREQGRSVVFRWAAILFGLGTLIHGLDHLRRGTDAVSSAVLLAGTVTTPIAVAAVFLALVGFRYAPHIAVVFGTFQVFGISAVHLAPHWSAFSDSIPGSDASPVSYVAVISEILGAALFAAAGAYVLLGNEESDSDRPLRARA